MRRIYKSFSRHLLVPDSFPFGINSILTNLLIKMKEHILDAEQLAETTRIYNYLCNQFWVQTPLMAMCTRYSIMW
jgi:hypothetical protein